MSRFTAKIKSWELSKCLQRTTQFVRDVKHKVSEKYPSVNNGIPQRKRDRTSKAIKSIWKTKETIKVIYVPYPVSEKEYASLRFDTSVPPKDIEVSQTSPKEPISDSKYSASEIKTIRRFWFIEGMEEFEASLSQVKVDPEKQVLNELSRQWHIDQEESIIYKEIFQREIPKDFSKHDLAYMKNTVNEYKQRRREKEQRDDEKYKGAKSFNERYLICEIERRSKVAEERKKVEEEKRVERRLKMEMIINNEPKMDTQECDEIAPIILYSGFKYKNTKHELVTY